MSRRRSTRLAPKGERELIRPALEPFGLKADDQKLWMAIAPAFDRIARDYLFFARPGATPRIGEVEDQLFNLEKAAAAMAGALNQMGPVALDWLFVHQTGDHVSQTDLLHMLRNARSIVGSYKEAADIAEPVVKLRTLAQLARPGEDVSEDFDKLVKGLEIKGVTQNPQQFQEYMEGIAKGINVFGDTLRPYEYYEMFKYGRQASAGLSEKFILGTGPTLAQELGGEGFGAAVAQFNRLLVSGVGKKGPFEELANRPHQQG
jgi:hypothetical protein